ncbi:MAG: XdhC family protein, partial [Alphaproteobacteria bacterium]
MKSATLARLQAERAAKRAVVLLTRLSDGAQLLWPGDEMPDALVEASKAALGSEEAGNVALGDETWFIHPHNPPLRISVVGAVHIAQAMAPMAAPLGFAMVVVDPRRAFASEERLPGVTLSTDWPDEAMVALAP